MKILSIGAFSKISNTSLHRTWALRKNADDVDMIETDAPKLSLWYRICHHLFLWGLPVRLPDEANANAKIRRQNVRYYQGRRVIGIKTNQEETC